MLRRVVAARDPSSAGRQVRQTRCGARSGDGPPAQGRSESPVARAPSGRARPSPALPVALPGPAFSPGRDCPPGASVLPPRAGRMRLVSNSPGSLSGGHRLHVPPSHPRHGDPRRQPVGGRGSQQLRTLAVAGSAVRQPFLESANASHSGRQRCPVCTRSWRPRRTPRQRWIHPSKTTCGRSPRPANAAPRGASFTLGLAFEPRVGGRCPAQSRGLPGRVPGSSPSSGPAQRKAGDAAPARERSRELRRARDVYSSPGVRHQEIRLPTLEHVPGSERPGKFREKLV